MAENNDDLERLSREQLILKARLLGVERPELMTRVELRDEIVRRSEPDIAQQKRARGFLGVARDLVASVVEAGLNLPDAAALIRGDNNREAHWKGPPPVATVTLAEIYATQGHLDRALRMLDELLLKEPDHDAARALRTRLATATDLPVAPVRRRQRISFADNAPINAQPVEPASDSVPETISASTPEPDSERTPQVDSTTTVEPEATLNFAPASAPAPQPEPTLDFAPAADPAQADTTSSAAPLPPEPAPAITPVPVPVPVPTPAVAAMPAPAVAPAPASPHPSLLTLALAGQRQIYWELPAESLNALRAHSPSGRPLVRVVSFRTRGGRVERHSTDVTPDSEVGFAVLPNLRADAVIRAVLGWETEGRFMPYLVASDLPSGTPSARRAGPFRANPLVGLVAHEVEQRALSHCSRRPAH